MKKTLALVTFSMLFFLSGLFVGRCGREEPVTITKRDTVDRWDTAYVEKPVWKDRQVLDTVYLPAIDTLWLRDSIYFSIEREQRTYKDTKYLAIVSGVMPSLDYIETYSLTQTITKTVKEKHSPWGISVGVGPFVGYGLRGIDAGVGLVGGITYTF